MQRIILKGATDRSATLRCLDATTGAPKTDVVFNSAGIDMWYRREGAAVVQVTEVTLAALTTAHTDGGFLHIRDGSYRFDLPDAAWATGANHVDVGGTVTGGVFVAEHFQLVDINVEDTVRAGLTALPNAAAAASGGLPILGTNATAISFTGGMTISNATGSGLTLSSGGSNGSGLNATGNGTGDGIRGTGGATGHGINGIGGSTSGSGLRGVGTAGNSAGVSAVGQGSASGLQATGGATGNGINGVGGSTSGVGIRGAAAGGNSVGIAGFGQGSSPGIQGTGGATGAGVNAVGGATSGAGLLVTATSGNGATITGGGTGSGIVATSGAGATGDGIQATAASTNGSGVRFTKTGTGVALGATTTDIVLAKTTNITGYTDLDAAGVRTAVGMASANLDTQLGTLATAANLATVDTVVDAIKVTTDKLDTALELDGAVYRYTANALELAPSGGGTIPTAVEIADEVQTRTIAAVTTVNGLAANSVTAAALAADAGSEIGTAVWATGTRTLTANPGLDAAGIRTAVGLATANLDTQIGTLATAANLATAAGYIDTEVAAIKAVTDVLPNAGALTSLAQASDMAQVKQVTDKLHTMVEVAPGSPNEFRFNADALELAPTGSGGGGGPTASQIADEVQTRTIAAVTTVNGLAANVITAASLDADAGTEIGTAVWATAARTLTAIDEDSTTLDLDATIRAAVGLGSANLDTQLADLPTNAELATALGTSDDAVLAAVATAQGDITSINGRLPSDPADASVVAGLIGGLDTKLDNIDGNVDAILLDTGTDGVVVAAASKTGYRLSSTGVDDVLRTALNEGYAAQGAEFTLEQALYMLWSMLAERAVAGTTLTASQIDGATPAMTFTLDDATTPTEQTRAT
jgi:hypothetical protein